MWAAIIEEERGPLWVKESGWEGPQVTVTLLTLAHWDEVLMKLSSFKVFRVSHTVRCLHSRSSGWDQQSRSRPAPDVFPSSSLSLASWFSGRRAWEGPPLVPSPLLTLTFASLAQTHYSSCLCWLHRMRVTEPVSTDNCPTPSPAFDWTHRACCKRPCRSLVPHPRQWEPTG